MKHLILPFAFAVSLSFFACSSADSTPSDLSPIGSTPTDSIPQDTIPTTSNPLDTLPKDSTPITPTPIDSTINQRPTSPVDSTFDYGVSLYRASAYDSAQIIFETLAADPSFSDPDAVQLYLGKTYKALTLPTEARTALEAVSSLSDWAPEALYLIAVLQYEAGFLDSANTNLINVYNQYPASYVEDGVLYYRAKISFEIGDFTGTKSLVDTYMLRYANNALTDNALNLRSQSSFQLADYLSAISDCEIILSQFNPGDFVDNASFWKARSQLMQGLVDSLNAVTYFNSAVLGFENFLASYAGASTNEDEALLYLGQSYFYLDQWNKARTTLAQFESQYPLSPDLAHALYFSGRTEMGDLQFRAALPFFRRILTDYPNSSRLDDAQFQIGKSYYRMGEPIEGTFIARDTTLLDTAALELQKALNMYPGSPKEDNTMLYLVRTYADWPKCTEAQNWLKQMQLKYPQSILLPYAQNHSGLRQNCP